MRVAVVGCGLIGRKRARALASHQLVACVDLVLERAESLAAESPGCTSGVDYRDVVGRPDVDAVIVATYNDALTPISVAALEAGKHVLLEKPGARDAAEFRSVIAAAERSGRAVEVGFNHRFHPAFQRARRIFDEGGVGELMFIRGRYGHGGRIGYDREWRSNPAISGGGELIDQGIHLIDLAHWFAGDFTEVSGHVATYFWDMPVDDNGFVLLKTAAGQVAWLQASCTEWKNMFSFEIYGRTGKLHIEGLGGSYGVERLTYYRMLPEMGPPETTSWEYPGEDRSWHAEFEHFARCIETGETPIGSPSDTLAALDIIGKLYGGARP